jgi:hypothetical protein
LTLRLDRIALAALLALAAPATGAQWRTDPMIVWLEGRDLDVLAGAFVAGSGGEDLQLLDQAFDWARTRRHQELLVPQPSAYPIAAGLQRIRTYRSGYLSQNGTDALADVASHTAAGGFPAPSTSQIEVVFGNDPATLRTFPLTRDTSFGAPPGGPPYVVSPLRLLAKPPASGRVGDVLVFPYCLDDVCSAVFLMDFTGTPLPAATERILPAPDLDPMNDQSEAFPAWISTVARSQGLDDVAIGSYGTVLLYTHRSLPSVPSPTLPDLDLSDPVVVGTTIHSGPRPAWLPPTIDRFAEVRGVASLDVDFDGQPDLVFAMTASFGTTPGELVWVQGTANPADFADPALTPWHDLGIHPSLQLPDVMTVRPLRVGGGPAVALWDRTLQEVLVVTSNAASQRLEVWRAPAPGALAKEIRLADLAGSPAPDLVVVMDNGAEGDSVLVYPDAGDLSPVLAWAPGSPGSPIRGVPHTLQVVVSDADAPTMPLVEWVLGAPTTAPLGQGTAYTVAPVCSVPAPPLVVTVRATDDLGVFTELQATLPWSTLQPAISLAGATPPGTLALAPGGTTAVFDGVAATACGAASWGGAWPAAATVTDTAGPSWMQRRVDLPEAAYPELLADPSPAVSLATTDPGVSQPVVTLPLELDGSGLVDVVHESDRTALAAGEIAVLRTRLRSRLGVTLAGVRIVDALSGLIPAGPPVVSGAAVVSVDAGGAGVLIDALPPAPAEVTLELPVRSAQGPGASAVEARSAGGWLLTAPARAEASSSARPGCGCGSGRAPAGLAVLALWLVRRRRRHAPVHIT